MSLAKVDLRHAEQTEGSVEVPVGIDMSEFYKSVEWDLLLVPAKYNEEYYDCCPEPYPVTKTPIRSAILIPSPILLIMHRRSHSHC